MKEITIFYNSKWFIPTVAIAFLVIATACVYFTFEHFHLWFFLFLIIAFVVFIKVITFLISTIFNLFR